MTALVCGSITGTSGCFTGATGRGAAWTGAAAASAGPETSFCFCAEKSVAASGIEPIIFEGMRCSFGVSIRITNDSGTAVFLGYMHCSFRRVMSLVFVDFQKADGETSSSSLSTKAKSMKKKSCVCSLGSCPSTTIDVGSSKNLTTDSSFGWRKPTLGFTQYRFRIVLRTLYATRDPSLFVICKIFSIGVVIGSGKNKLSCDKPTFGPAGIS